METTRYQIVQSLYATNNALSAGLTSSARASAQCAQIALNSNITFNLPLIEKDRARIVAMLENAIESTDNPSAISHLYMAMAQIERARCYICGQEVAEGSDKCPDCNACFIPVIGNGVRPAAVRDVNFWE